MKKKTTEQFIQEAKSVHGQKYSYEDTRYTTALGKITIRCPVHGDFSQRARHHLDGKGCPSCSGNRKIDTEEFISRSREAHGNKYTYENVSYVNSNTPVLITCLLHGDFKQIPYHHLSGSGCPRCHHEKVKHLLSSSHQDFVRKAKAVHDNKYDYIKTPTFTGSAKTTIICPNHGSFEQLATNHLRGSGCPKCASIISAPEQEMAKFIRELGFTVHNNDRSIISPYEVDILVEEKNVAIEYCGLRWHSEVLGGKNRSYHLNKHNMCSDVGIRLITIFEDEWLSKPEIIKATIRNILGKGLKGVYARDTRIENISWSNARDFLDRYHLQSAGSPSPIRYGAYYDGELISVMTFSRGRAALNSNGSDLFEMVRFCSDGRNHPGLASKMFHQFKLDYSPSTVVSYADRRWFTGDSYQKLGFQQTGYTKPSYWYIKEQQFTRTHRYTFRKHKIVEMGGEPNMSEWENMKSLGYDRIWDCGTIRYEWNA